MKELRPPSHLLSTDVAQHVTHQTELLTRIATLLEAQNNLLEDHRRILTSIAYKVEYMEGRL